MFIQQMITQQLITKAPIVAMAVMVAIYLALRP
jgi:hypothetical protein